MPETPDDTNQLLKTYLASNDASCPGCGYNLRGVIKTCCPECGAHITLGVVAPNARIGPWMLATVSFALALGFDWVAMILAIIPSIIFGPPNMGGAPIYWKGLLALFLLGFTSGIGLFAMLRTRAWWQRQPPASQWSRAALIFLAVFIIHAAGGAWIIL
jgi:hypothetical protein